MGPHGDAPICVRARSRVLPCSSHTIVSANVTDCLQNGRLLGALVSTEYWYSHVLARGCLLLVLQHEVVKNKTLNKPRNRRNFATVRLLAPVPINIIIIAIITIIINIIFIHDGFDRGALLIPSTDTLDRWAVLLSISISLAQAMPRTTI
uniref:Uncharacterized protein n=1 Tax=Anopheles coluzzii TaxID=1518534 RepID=A0A8W7PKD3_ANOCL